jgi:3-oxoacyl-(acyl-carrier-protein) synthase
MFVLETLDSALARPVTPLCEMLGYGAAGDATHIAKPGVEGQAAAMAAALADAALDGADVDHVNAHGTGTKAGDLCETLAIKRVFGDHAARLTISSTKSAHGHLLGAAGAIELAATLVALRDRFTPATLHLFEPDPECDLDYVPCAPRLAEGPRRAMTNSFAFGGSNAVLIVGRVAAASADGP